MTDDRRTDEPVEEVQAEDDLPEEDRLPWLEAVEEDDERDGPSVAKLIGAILIGLVAIGLIVGGLFWLGNRSSEGGDGELIAAPEGDYKIKPDEPGGMNVAGEGDTRYAASEGSEPKGRLDDRAVPERPVTPAPAPQRPATQPQPQAQPQRQPQVQPQRRPQPQRPVPTPAASGPTVQLGAFSSQAAANRAWSALSGRFRYLAPLSHSVVSVQSGGRTLYRLRASGPDAAGVCRRLRVAGEDCAPVGG